MTSYPFDHMHVWIGRFDGTKRLFEDCFDLQPFYKSQENQEFEPCAFSRYLNVTAYSEDIFGAYYVRGGLLKLLAKMNLCRASSSKLEILSRDLKLNNPNAAVVYGVMYLEDSSQIEEAFKGLVYLGEFKD